MTADQRFGLIISGIGLVFAALSTVAGLLWRAGRSAGQTLTEVKANGEQVKNLAAAVDRHLRWHIDHPPPRR